MPKASRTPASASVGSAAKPTVKAGPAAAKKAAPAGVKAAPKKPTGKRAGSATRVSSKDAARAATMPDAPGIDGDVDITPVRIIDDRRFTGKFQVIEDEGDHRVLGWGFDSILSAKRWIENRNKLSSWLQLLVRGE